MRFRELQAEKELRQLQEDRKNDRKPPPYKHIKVQEKTFADVYEITTAALTTTGIPQAALYQESLISI